MYRAKRFATSSGNDNIESPFVSFTELLTGTFLILVIIVAAFALNLDDRRHRCHELSEGKIDRVDQDTKLIKDFADGLLARGVNAEFDCNGQSVILPEDILFKTGTATITTIAQREAVAKLAASLKGLLFCTKSEKECPDLSGLDTILIEGHADRAGQADVNWQLSVGRAFSVYQYLINLVPQLKPSIAPDNGRSSWLAIAGYGETRPIIPTKDGEENQRNRRIELRFIFRR